MFRDVSGLLKPRSIAIVGASQNPESWTARIYRNLQTFGFAGPVYPVNPNYPELYGTRCYPALSALPETPDHLVIMVRAGTIPSIVAEGGALGARSAMILSAGFEELGTAEGRAAAVGLTRATDRYDVRICGPNCLGNIGIASNTVTFCEQNVERFRPGGFAFVSQSSAVMGAAFRYAALRGVGVSYGIGTGNEFNTDVADLLSFFADDPDTRVVGLFVEGIRRPEAFVAACEKLARANKPVLYLKAGRTRAGRAAALSHTGALAGSHEVFTAVAERYGLIPFESTDQAVELAELASRCTFPRPDGLAAITLSGGIRGVLIDLADELGIKLAELSPATTERLQSMLGVGSGVGNPLDIGWGGLSSRETYFACLRALLEDPAVSIVAIQEELPRSEAVRRRAENFLVMEQLGREHGKPIIFFSRGTYSVTEYGLDFHDQATAPYLIGLRNAASALGKLMPYQVRREAALRPRESAADEPLTEPWRARLHGRQGPLPDDEAFGLLADWGIPTAPWRLVDTSAAAVRAAEAIGFPVALKLSVPGLTHKTEAGGVRLQLASGDEVAAAAAELLDIASRNGQAGRLLVQQMAAPGLELLLSCARDPRFGPMVNVGLGGIWVEVLGDLQTRPAPIDPLDAREMLDRLRARALLRGARGAPPRDEAAAIAALVALSRLGAALGDLLGTIEINPFVVGARGAGGVAVDALVIAEPLGETGPLAGQSGQSSGSGDEPC